MNMALQGLSIAKAHHEACLKAILALGPTGPTDPDPLDPNRALGSALYAATWSKFVPDSPDLESVLKGWGFNTYVSTHPREELILEFFHHDIAAVAPGEEKELFKAIAPFVAPTLGHEATDTPVIVTVADEEASWRYIFKDGKVRSQRAVITWEDC
jgi:hypothetical protein